MNLSVLAKLIGIKDNTQALRKFGRLINQGDMLGSDEAIIKELYELFPPQSYKTVDPTTVKDGRTVTTNDPRYNPDLVFEDNFKLTSSDMKKVKSLLQESTNFKGLLAGRTREEAVELIEQDVLNSLKNKTRVKTAPELAEEYGKNTGATGGNLTARELIGYRRPERNQTFPPLLSTKSLNAVKKAGTKKTSERYKELVSSPEVFEKKQKTLIEKAQKSDTLSVIDGKVIIGAKVPGKIPDKFGILRDRDELLKEQARLTFDPETFQYRTKTELEGGISNKVLAASLNTSEKNVGMLLNQLRGEMGVEELTFKGKKRGRDFLTKQSDVNFEEKIRELVTKEGFGRPGGKVTLDSLAVHHGLVKGVPDKFTPYQTTKSLMLLNDITNSVLIRPAEDILRKLTKERNGLAKSMLTKGPNPKIKKRTTVEQFDLLADLNKKIAHIVKLSKGRLLGTVVDPTTFKVTTIGGNTKFSLYSRKIKGKPIFKNIADLNPKDRQIILERAAPSLIKTARGELQAAVKDLEPLLKDPEYYQEVVKLAKEYNIELPKSVMRFNKILTDKPNESIFRYREGYESGNIVRFPQRIDPADIEAEKEMALSIDGEILTDKEAIQKITERLTNFANGGSVDIFSGIEAPLSTEDEITGNKVGLIKSALAGIGSGLIDIPKGAFSLGATLLDLGFGTNNAAKVENFFDDLTTLDELAEARLSGQMTRIITNLGVPGAAAFKLGSSLSKAAVTSKRAGNYFRAADPKLASGFSNALNAKGKFATTLGGIAGVGVSDAVFVGDPEKIGTMGDLFGGPTAMDVNTDDEASVELMNRFKFGVDSAAFVGLLSGTGQAIGSAVKRAKNNRTKDDALNKIFNSIRPSGSKGETFFGIERESIGLRASDINKAGEVARRTTNYIDSMYPDLKPALMKEDSFGRDELLSELKNVLLSGQPRMTGIGPTFRTVFDPIENIGKAKNLRDKLVKYGTSEEKVNNIFNQFNTIRGSWGEMFTSLGKKMEDKNLEAFKDVFGDKFQDYLGSTYNIFEKKSVFAFANYKPTAEATKRAFNSIKESAAAAGKEITDEQAEGYVDLILQSARMPKGLTAEAGKTTGVLFKGPAFLANKTVLDDVVDEGGERFFRLESVEPKTKKIFKELFGEVKNPVQTILSGTGRLSFITRRNEFFESLRLADDAVEKSGLGNRMFAESYDEAVTLFGPNVSKIENIDPNKFLRAGGINPLEGKYAPKAIVDALTTVNKNSLNDSFVGQIYSNLILYPKSTSQLAKTVLSPITHFRNFFSAGAFTAANGLLPGFVGLGDTAQAFKKAYGSLQVGRLGTEEANKEYRKLLRLGVVNSNVRLGDLRKLLDDVGFGTTFNADNALKKLASPFRKLKKFAEDGYTAEDDFWKITSYAMERSRLENQFRKFKINPGDEVTDFRGIKVKYGDDFLDNEAADIVRNNIPNYDYVNDVIKSLRKLPFGNFVSFPAEIMRTSAEIIKRGVRDIGYKVELPDGKVLRPLRSTGFQRLFGFGLTTTAIPYGTVEAAKAIYDVSEDEMAALRRFVPDWSKNSTLVPIKDKDGNFKYVDFSHANAYDTMIRPINTMINAVRDGNLEERSLDESIMLGVFDGMKETFSPFISESIFTEAVTDVIFRSGRTREGRSLYTENTPIGEKVTEIIKHVAQTQVPGSIDAFKRIDQSIKEVDVIRKGEFDEYGRQFKFGDEMAGFLGMRAVEVDPVKSMDFKTADFLKGVSNSRRLFTSELLKGGSVTPAQIVDRYKAANKALYGVHKNLFLDYYGANQLGASFRSINGAIKDRISQRQINEIRRGRFTPFKVSDAVRQKFRENARGIGERDPYSIASREINNLYRIYNRLPLLMDDFPEMTNVFEVITPDTGATSVTAAPNLGLTDQVPALEGLTNPGMNTQNTLQTIQTLDDFITP